MDDVCGCVMIVLGLSHAYGSVFMIGVYAFVEKGVVVEDLVFESLIPCLCIALAGQSL